MKEIAVLFARRNSVYKTLPGCDVWDADRDARNWSGGCPVVAHPPCGQWGRLARLARADEREKQLGLIAAHMVRLFGGVLEHPAGSLLWDAAGLPKPENHEDEFGGFTIVIDQLWFGHCATKRTWLYVFGVQRSGLPPIPFSLEYPTRSISTRQRAPKRLPELSRAGREATPPRLAEWLCAVAREANVEKERAA